MFAYTRIITAPSVEHKYVNAGDVVGFDKTLNDFTRDSGWHELDLSAIVPAGTVLVHCRVRLYADASKMVTEWKEWGNAQNKNVARVFAHAGSGDWGRSFWVACDTDRSIAYMIQTGSWTNIDFVVRGWILGPTE